jgi:hypothetical protein
MKVLPLIIQSEHLILVCVNLVNDPAGVFFIFSKFIFICIHYQQSPSLFLLMPAGQVNIADKYGKGLP